jgi:regulator of protease activity HflC (stomatin/prohibitin superfamily)
VKVTQVELCNIVSARAAILTSEGEREAAVNSVRGQGEARILNAEASQKSVLLAAETDSLRDSFDSRQQQILRAQGIASSTQALSQCLKDPDAQKAVEVLFALGYLDMGTAIRRSDSAKVMFMDPRTVPAALEGIRSVIGDSAANAKV